MKGTFTILPDVVVSAFDANDRASLEAGIDRTADLVDTGMRGR